MSVKRVGRLSQKDINFLKENGAKLTVEEIATQLNRHEETVRKWLNDNKIKNIEYYDTNEERSKIKNQLLGEIFWKQTQDQYTERERDYFIAQYCEHILQLEKLSPVEYTEKMQIMHMIRQEILLDRLLTNQKRAYDQMQEFEREMDNMKKDGDPKNEGRISNLARKIEGCHHIFTSYTKELKAIQEQIDKSRSSIGATREQRIKDIKEVAKDFAKVVANLQSQKFRQEEGAEINVFKAAMEVEKRKLSEWHTYADGKEDIPLLTPEIVDKLKKDQ